MIGELLQDTISRFDTLFELLQFILGLRLVSDVSSTFFEMVRTYEELFEQFCLFVWQLPMLWYGCHIARTPSVSLMGCVLWIEGGR
jgi:hypothetical protein